MRFSVCLSALHDDTLCKGNLYLSVFIEYVFPNLHIFHRKKKTKHLKNLKFPPFLFEDHIVLGSHLHQSSNPKLVGQAAVLKNRELDSVGSKNSWHLGSWVTQDLANNTVPLYLWVVPPSQFASHHDFYIVTESQIKPWFATSQHSGTRGSRSNLYSLLLWVDSWGFV